MVDCSCSPSSAPCVSGESTRVTFDVFSMTRLPSGNYNEKERNCVAFSPRSASDGHQNVKLCGLMVSEFLLEVSPTTRLLGQPLGANSPHSGWYRFRRMIDKDFFACDACYAMQTFKAPTSRGDTGGILHRLLPSNFFYRHPRQLNQLFDFRLSPPPPSHVFCLDLLRTHWLPAPRLFVLSFCAAGVCFHCLFNGGGYEDVELLKPIPAVPAKHTVDKEKEQVSPGVFDLSRMSNR